MTNLRAGAYYGGARRPSLILRFPHFDGAGLGGIYGFRLKVV